MFLDMIFTITTLLHEKMLSEIPNMISNAFSEKNINMKKFYFLIYSKITVLLMSHSISSLSMFENDCSGYLLTHILFDSSYQINVLLCESFYDFRLTFNCVSHYF